MRTCAVIVAAWRAERWIGECLRAIEGQKELPGWRWQLRLAVDACEPTSHQLRKLKVTHWWTPVNVGPYVLRNTLIGLEPADAYAVFDADDIMEPRYLEQLVKLAWPNHIAGSARMTINDRGKIRSRRSLYRHGVSVISHEAWMRVGGYRGWRIAADSDLTSRAQELGISVRSTSRSLYRRRKHAGSLTMAPATRFRSPAREATVEESRRLIAAGDLVVSPETTDIFERVA